MVPIWELCAYREVIYATSRKLCWSAVYSYDLRFRTKLASEEISRFYQLDQTLYTTVLDATALRSDIRQCARCNGHDHLAGNVFFVHNPRWRRQTCRCPRKRPGNESNGSMTERRDVISSSAIPAILKTPANGHMSARAAKETTPWQIAQCLPKPWSPFHVVTRREALRNHPDCDGAVTITFKTPRLTGKRIFHCDNEAVVHILQNGRSVCPHIMILAHYAFFLRAHHSIKK